MTFGPIPQPISTFSLPRTSTRLLAPLSSFVNTKERSFERQLKTNGLSGLFYLSIAIFTFQEGGSRLMKSFPLKACEWFNLSGDWGRAVGHLWSRSWSSWSWGWEGGVSKARSQWRRCAKGQCWWELCPSYGSRYVSWEVPDGKGVVQGSSNQALLICRESHASYACLRVRSS